MNKPTLLYYNISGFQKETLKHIGEFFQIVTLPDPDYSHDIDDIQNVDALIAPMGYVFDKSKLDCFNRLRVIGTPTTGTIHIDTTYSHEKGIRICSLKSQQQFLATITPTAELALGLILAITRQIPQAFNAVCNNIWNGREFGKKTPKMLSQMSLGIVGLGRLGLWMARYGKALNMKVYYYDPYTSNEQYNKCDNILDLAKLCNIVTVHTHLTKETENIIDQTFMESMPKPSYIINTARGGIVNEDDLLLCLSSGCLSGAGLDMLKNEHLPEFKNKLSNHPLISYAKCHDNLIITPKMGGCTLDAWEKTEIFIVDMMKDVFYQKEVYNSK